MQKPLISVITVCFNAAKTLSKTIDSVRGQTFQDFEYIIVDGLSKDETPAIIADYAGKDSRIRWVSEKDRGIYDAMNKGARMAKGQFLHFVNADDHLIDRNVYELAAPFLRDAGVTYYGRLRYVHGDGQIRLLGFPTNAREQKYELRGIHQPAMFFSKSSFDQVGEFRTDLRISGDYEFIRRLVEQTRIEFIPQTLLEMHDDGASAAKFDQAIKENYAIAVGQGEPRIATAMNSGWTYFALTLRYRFPRVFHALLALKNRIYKRPVA